MSHSLPRRTPESQGIPASAILSFIQAVEESALGLHSLMIVRNGYVVTEGWWSPYKPEYSHMLFSLSKSFTSTAAGIAVEEGFFSLDDTVISFFPGDLPDTVSDNLAEMQVKHLLSMSTGHADDTTGALHGSDNWAKQFLACDVTYKPGTHFLYNTGATYMVSAIIQKTTGMRVLDYLTPRLFEPLGIEGAIWDTNLQGIDVGGWGLHIKTEDIAKFSLLYLQKGKWNDVQLIPAAYVEAATSKQISNGDDPNSDWAQGYCYQFWRCRHNVYRADGAFGQFGIVMPDQNAVIAITAGCNDMGAVFNLIWEKLLPVMQPGDITQDAAVSDKLITKLNTLTLPFPEGEKWSPWMSEINGGVYRFPENDQNISTVSFRFNDDHCIITIGTKDRLQDIPCGYKEWKHGESEFGVWGANKAATSGAWLDEQTFVVQSYFYEGPFCYMSKCHFEGHNLTIENSINVSFVPTTYAAITGTA